MNALDENVAKNIWFPRSKVLKLVSAQPYRIGRWICVEFEDCDVNNEIECGLEQITGNDVTNCLPLNNDGLAIDNKIEQAMDLVKSHLMFAVREEVDILRERIAELSAKVEQLERENSMLRAHASIEIIALL